MLYEKIKEKTPITKGWSEDKKYKVKSDGRDYLLRVSPIEKESSRRHLFGLLKELSSLGIPMCEPVECGLCEDGFYTLLSWIDGVDVEQYLSFLDEKMQYSYGLEAGSVLKNIHFLPAPSDLEDWEERFSRKARKKIENYKNCGLSFPDDNKMMDYLEENFHLLKDRPQCFQHGDYHVGNMMMEKNKLIIIDFDRFDYCDPWEEFNRIVWCVQASPSFASGMVDGYFGGEPPFLFWKLLSFYSSSNMLSSFPWAIPFGKKQIEIMMKQSQEILSWYNQMSLMVPKWYHGKD